MRAIIRLVALGLALAFATIAPAAAQTFPALSGRVVDEAGILDATRRSELTQKLADLEAKTTDQLVVVTVRSLQGHTIEDYGVRLGRQWKIGQATKNNGVLLIVAPTDRKVRIEVGYGLEGVLPDAVASFIIQQTILPNFRSNDIPRGISRGVDAIIQVLSGDAAEWRARAARAQPTLFTRTMHGAGRMLSWMPADMVFLAGLFVLGVVVSLISLAWLRICLPVLFTVAIALGLMSKDRWGDLARRQAKWHFVNIFASGGSGRSSGSSGSSSFDFGSSFSGGGGSFGGGGSSGSW